mgnify:CR=1 FL=1
MDPLKAHISQIEQSISKKYEDSDYDECYIAFLDILGMKKIVQKEYTFLREIFNTIEVAISLYGNAKIVGSDSFISEDQIRLTVLSDAIVISIKSKTDQAFSKLIGICSYFVKKLISKPNSPIFLRGGITKGNLFHSGGIVFGPALVNAYELEDDVADSMRCILDPQLENDRQVKEYVSSNNALCVDEVDGLHYISFITDENKKILSDTAEEILSSNIDSDIKDKYNWLLKKLDNETNA